MPLIKKYFNYPLSPLQKIQNSSGLVIIFSPIQSLEERSVCAWRNQGDGAAVGKESESFLSGSEKRAASQVEQRMRDEECLSDVAEEAKVGEKEKRKLEADG